MLQEKWRSIQRKNLDFIIMFLVVLIAVASYFIIYVNKVTITTEETHLNHTKSRIVETSNSDLFEVDTTDLFRF